MNPRDFTKPIFIAPAVVCTLLTKYPAPVPSKRGYTVRHFNGPRGEYRDEFIFIEEQTATRAEIDIRRTKSRQLK